MKKLAAILFVLAGFPIDHSFAQAQSSGIPVWVWQEPQNCDGPCPSPSFLRMIYATEAASRPSGSAVRSDTVRFYEIATTSQVEQGFKSLLAAIQTEFKNAAMGELETKLLEKISVLERRVVELEASQQKSSPVGKPPVKNK